MMVLVNSRTPSEDESSRGQMAALQVDTLRFGSLAASTANTTPTTTDEERQEQLKDTLATGEDMIRV